MATSVLNPNAPIFVPSSYRAVEDFSDQWWDLVQSSPYFRDYWLQECFSDSQSDSPLIDFTGDDVRDDGVIDDANAVSKGNEGNKRNMDLMALGWLKWRKPRAGAEMPKYCEKAPKIVSVRVNPRPIHQPR